MKQKKDTILFGNDKDIVKSNFLIGMGIGGIIVSTISLAIGEYIGYKNLTGFAAKDQVAIDNVNKMYDDFMDVCTRKGA